MQIIYLVPMRRVVVRYAFPLLRCLFCFSPGHNFIYASSVWAVLERFGYEKAFGELNGSGIHRLENILTLDLHVHRLFDTFRLWLESVESVSKLSLLCVSI